MKRQKITNKVLDEYVKDYKGPDIFKGLTNDLVGKIMIVIFGLVIAIEFYLIYLIIGELL